MDDLLAKGMVSAVAVAKPENPSLYLAGREELLDHAAAVVSEAWRSFDRFREGQPELDASLVALLQQGLPESGADPIACLDDAARALDQSLAQPRPRFFAYIGGAGLEVGVIADLLASCFDVNLASWAGAASEIEEQAARWLGELLGYPVGGAVFTSGGTLSNISALIAAREAAIPGARQTGIGGRRLALYCSSEAHYSVFRAVETLGIGSDSVRSIPIDAQRRLRVDLLAEALAADKADGVHPVAVIATAGTTLTGAVDPLDEIATLCEEHRVWFHVDGAYGLPAAAATTTAQLFRGLERADSVSVDAHKWLYMPKACGVLLVRRLGDLHTAFGHEEDYFPHERQAAHAADTTLEYSRPFRALKLWLAFRIYGAAALREAIERNLAHAMLCYEMASARNELETLPERPQLSIVPFRHVPAGVADLDAHNEEIVRRLQASGDVWLSSASIDGNVYLRPCFVNYRTADADVVELVELARRTGNEILAELPT